MKLKVRGSFFRGHSRGYAAMAMVAVIGVTALLSLMFVFRTGMRSHEMQVMNQVKIDYRQKEDALLRALVYVVPNKAIGAMMPNSAGNASNYSWDQIFTDAITLSNAGGALNSAVVDGFGISGIINANTGDMNLSSTNQIVGVVAGDGSLMGPGNVSNTGLLADGLTGGKLPPPLAYSGSYSNELEYPIISLNKKYPSSTPGLGASADATTGYPVYNIIDYPDIRFGLSNQSGKFVAKRNWWAFSLTFGGGGTGPDAMPTMKKNYILSIYEVPEQMALSAAGKLQVGTFADGTNWQNTTIRGGVFAGEVEAKNLSLLGASSRVSARRSVKLNGTNSVGGGMSITAGFDRLGTRETRWASSGSDFYGASVASDSGRVAVLPLSQGDQFIRTSGAVAQTNTLSDTGWYEYAMGALQCKMKLEVTKQQTSRPIEIRFTCQQGAGTLVKNYKSTDGTWVNFANDVPANGPQSLPFYWENLGATGHPALAVNLDEIPDYLAGMGLSPGDVTRNNSLSISADTSADPSVVLPSLIDDSAEMSVVFRQAEDLTIFTKGLSIVTDYKVYFAENFNQKPVLASDVPNNAGLPSGDYYPPVSVFASHKHFGTVDGAIDAISMSGQITSLNADDGTVVNPLDLKGGANLTVAGQAISANKISADLSQIVSPAELPPINRMTWLVTIEEIQGTAVTIAANGGGGGGGLGDGDDEDDSDDDDD
ncbi:MAG: hypothetical protein QM496_08660 [Verrucomicrobiota bacterium]